MQLPCPRLTSSPLHLSGAYQNNPLHFKEAIMEDTKKKKDSETMDTPEEKTTPDPNWAHDALQELEDWIESQGVYIRQ